MALPIFQMRAARRQAFHLLELREAPDSAAEFLLDTIPKCDLLEKEQKDELCRCCRRRKVQGRERVK